MYTVTFTVEAEVRNNEVDDTFSEKDLIGQCAKVKSGLYENAIMGTITSATVVEVKNKKTRKYRGN